MSTISLCTSEAIALIHFVMCSISELEGEAFNIVWFESSKTCNERASLSQPSKTRISKKKRGVALFTILCCHGGNAPR